MGSEVESNGTFPTLCGGGTKDTRLCVQEVTAGSASEIRRFCNKSELSEQSFYLVVWSLVLRAFVETDRVCLGFGDFRAKPVELAHVPLNAIHTIISPRRPISQLQAEFNVVPEDPSLKNQEASHNTGVVLLPATTNPLELSGLVKSTYPLLLTVTCETSTGLPEKLFIVYLSSHLAPFHAEHISSNVTQAVEQVLAHPNGCVGDIDLFSPLNKDTVSRWNAVRQQPTCLLEVIRGHAMSRPDYPAICAWDGTVSYSELDILSTRWAGYLQNHGVGPKCLVPVMIDRSKWAIIGQVAVLKAGGAFVPLDSTQPVSRLEYIVQQTHSRIALASAHFVNKLSNLVDNVIAISDEETTNLPSTGQDVLRPTGSDRTAYVLFTSGSTGRSKGCVMGYRALSDVVNQTAALKINRDSRVLQFASYTYGMALIEVYCTLATGATICVPAEEDRLNCLDVVLRSMRVTWAILTPSAIWSIVESVGCLTTLVVAGEAWTSDLLSSLAEKVELIQAFGLTEWSGICCVSHRITSENEMRVIGRSPTARLWLVDPIDSNKLAPVGAVSELLVEGPALADGYLGEPLQTAAAFLERPPGPVLSTGAAFYRTGDLVQYTADGSLQYIARKDNQVKIRGMRIELAEVEHRIRQAHAMLEKVIVEAAPTKNSRGTPILAAFLYTGKQSVLQEQSFLDMIGTIKNSLRLTLPGHMHPSVYIPLTAIPLTISRKVDRKALRQIVQKSTRDDLERVQSSVTSIVTPRTDVERQLHLLVAKVLRLDSSSFGMNQSFISLGGDSITAMLLVNQCKKHGFKVTVAAALQAQSIADVASRIRVPSTSTAAETSPKSKTTGVSSNIAPACNECVTIPKLPHSGPVEQSFSQARMWFLQTLHPESTWLLLPSAVRLQGPLQVDALQAALCALEERHETLRTTFESSTGSGVQLVAPFYPRPLKVLDIASGSQSELMRALHQQQLTAMDLTKESWRVVLFRLSPTEHVLSVVLHHIICDGWSFDIFMKTLEVYYAAAVRGQNPLQHAEPLPIQYRDFSSWQRQGKLSGIQDQLAYWVRQLTGSQPAEFLSDKKRPISLSGMASSQPVKIDHSLYQSLLQFCKAQQATPFTVLLAAFRATHFRLTGASDATIGIPCAARNLRELEGLIGYFGNVQCIRTKIEDASESFQQLVLQVQSATTAAFENQDVPFDQIVSKMLKSRDLSRHPLVQVAFIVHSQKNFAQLRLDGLETEQLSLPQSTRLDLEFHLHPGEEDLHGEILYSVDLFNPESIKAMLSVFYDVLRGGLRHPDVEIRSLPLSDAYPSLHQRGLVYPPPKGGSPEDNIIDAFYQSVLAGPHEIAVRDTHAQLTYLELDRRSSTLAAWLRDHYAFAKETPVAVYANRSCESIIATLGILKAHLAYVPLDVNSPVHRTETILSCLPGCHLVLVASDLPIPSVSSQSVAFVHVKDCVSVETKQADSWSRPTSPPPRPTSLAYILFTSGTTGKPKGVMIEHQSVLRLAKDPEIITHSLCHKVGAHLLNPAFDASGLEIYSTILNGGTLICIDKTVVFDFPTLTTIFIENGVTRAVMTPAMLNQCLISAPSLISILSILYVGGDKLDPADITKTRGLSNVRIFNCYGPTENTVVSTRYDVPLDEAGVNGIPIGRSVPQSGAYVMDPNLRLVPMGVMGELVVTGRGLARGYTNAEHNVNRFVTIYINGVAERAYRTGDVVRYRPSDAQLEFFGRMDQQVKIRGHRIEVSEIDNVLLSHGFITAAVTVVQRDEQDGRELVSFVTVEDVGVELEAIDELVEGKHVNGWRNIVESDDQYGHVGDIQPSTLGNDFLGWVSMYNGEAIDKSEMSEWLDDTVATIRRYGPSRVLEIGTGTGMVLFNLIGNLQAYRGLEPSTQAAGFVQKAVHWVPGAARKVRIQCGTASDVAKMAGEGPFDVAIINSVVQYFPSLRYLRNLIQDLTRLDGIRCIVLGDIRSFALYEEFQVSKVLHLHGHTLTGSQFRQRMAEIAQLEKELLVDPAFFTALAVEMSDVIGHVEILPKRMKATNELSCYRYAAILHLKCPGHALHVRELSPSSWVDFKASGLNYHSLLRLLKMSSDGSVLAVSNIPDKKTIVERHIVDSLGDLASGVDTAGWSERASDQAQDCPALEPVDLVDLAQQTGWQVEISWARQRSQTGGVDAIFHRPDRGHEEPRMLFRFPTDAPKSGLRGNDPVAFHRNQNIAERVLDDLRTKLPSYMVPKMVQVLDRLPVNNVGKVDRQTLSQRSDITSATETPKARSLSRCDPSLLNGVDRVLWEEFTSALGTEVGTTDSFFDLGGHSLMAIKLVSRINKRLGSDLRVSELFKYATIACLSKRLYGHRAPSSLTSAYKPFSLLGSNISSVESLHSSDLAELGLPAGVEVLDIFPVTETQAWYLSDWGLVSHSFRVNGHVDIDRLRAACRAVVRHHVVLRTLFTKFQKRLVQVVCGDIEAPFSHEYMEPRLGAVSKSFCNDDGGGMDAPAKLLTAFSLTSLSTTEHIFTLQLSHAQYDGLSLSSILSDIASAYSGRTPLTNTISFAHYVQVSRSARSHDTLDFWKNYLEGSILTTTPLPTNAMSDKHAAITREAMGTLPPLPGITFPTLINAALALTLSGISKRNDITVACMMNARDILTDGSESVLGPCANRTLLRVHVSEEMTASEFCRSLANNQARVSAHNYLGLTHVIQSCTNWPSGQMLAPFLTHLPADTAVPELPLSAVKVSHESTDVRINPGNQVFVRSRATEEHKACIQIQASSGVMDGDGASSLAWRVLATAQALSKAPEGHLRLISGFSS